MSDSDKTLDSVIKALEKSSVIFFPGIMIVGAAYFSHPCWFQKVDPAKNQWLIVLGAVAIVAGNVWLVFHRYFVQQIVDLLFFVFDPEGSPVRRKNSNYRVALADHVSEFFWNAEEKPALARHIRFRTSSVVLMYIASEVAILLAFTTPANRLVCSDHLLMALGVVGFLGSMWQNFIVRKMEEKISSYP